VPNAFSPQNHFQLKPFVYRNEWKKHAESLQETLDKTERKARRKEKQLRSALAAAEAEREYLRSLYNGSILTLTHGAARARDGAAVHDMELQAVEARCTGMEDEIRRLRVENEALRSHMAAVNLKMSSSQRSTAELVAAAQHDARAAGLQLTPEEDIFAPFSCSTSPIPKQMSWQPRQQVNATSVGFE
jgi:hypothetical protein